MKSRFKCGVLAFFFILFLVYMSCTEKYPPQMSKYGEVKESGCTACHLDADLLKEVADPLPGDENHTGEG